MYETTVVLVPDLISPRRALRSRIAVLVYFFLAGGVFGNWVARIPAIQRELDLSEGQLGLALLGLAVGALLAMPLAGFMVGTFGSRFTSGAAALATATTLLGPAFAVDTLTLGLLLGLYGLANGTLDVSMNVAAVHVERAYRRTLMPSFHALFSLGGLAGATIGGLFAQGGIEPLPHFTIVAILFAMSVVVVARWPMSDPARPESEPRSRSGLARPDRPLILLGLIAFCTLLSEGAMGDWSAVYLAGEFGASEGLAAAGFAGFSLAMAAGRFSGNALTDKLGPVAMVRGGGICAIAGLSLALGTSNTWIAIAGFVLIGIGYASIFPIVLSAAAGATSQSPGSAIASLSAIAYLGFLAGPPVIGLVAEYVGLRGGLLIVLALNFVIVFLASGTRYAGPPSISPEPSPEELK